MKITKLEKLEIQCGIPQGSILGSLLFIIYINNLAKAADVLDPIMFADDTNLLYSNNNIQDLFLTMNKELKNIAKCFDANKLLLNLGKTRCSFFHKSIKKEGTVFFTSQ